MADINTAKSKINESGFLDIEVDPTIDLFAEIEKLKKEKNILGENQNHLAIMYLKMQGELY